MKIKRRQKKKRKGKGKGGRREEKKKKETYVQFRLDCAAEFISSFGAGQTIFSVEISIVHSQEFVE